MILIILALLAYQIFIFLIVLVIQHVQRECTKILILICVNTVMELASPAGTNIIIVA